MSYFWNQKNKLKNNKKQFDWKYTRIAFSSFHQETKKELFLKFLFPYYPIKLYRSTHLLLTVAILLSLRLILGMFSIYIPSINITLGFGWIANMMMGWFFGPLVSLLLGAVSDTITFYTSGGGLWFWMYAIQEPLVCFISGVMGGICSYRANKQKINVFFDLIVIEVLFSLFAFITIFVLSQWLNPENNTKISPNIIVPLKAAVISLISIYILIMQIVLIHGFNKREVGIEKTVTSIYSILMCFLIILVFSFILGPLVSLEYYKWLHGGQLPPGASEDMFKYLITVGLIPRIIKESIKTPIEATIVLSLIFMLNPIFKRTLNNATHKWNTNKKN